MQASSFNCRIANLCVQGVDLSPVKHIRFAGYCGDREAETRRLEKVVAFVWERQLALTVARYLDAQEANLPDPSIRLIISANLTDAEMDWAFQILAEAFEQFASQ